MCHKMYVEPQKTFWKRQSNPIYNWIFDVKLVKNTHTRGNIKVWILIFPPGGGEKVTFGH